MPASWSPQPAPPLTSFIKILLSWVGVLFFVLLLLILSGCAEAGRSKMQVVSGRVYSQNGNPLREATVRIQTTQFSTTSDIHGQFTLSIPTTEDSLALTAWAPGYFNAGPVLIQPGDTEIRIELSQHPDFDNSEYRWISSFAHAGADENQGCATCHSSSGTEISFSLPVDQWQLDAHANTARNPRFLTMYLGTDIQGNQSPLTEQANTKDYGTAPLKPDPALPYYGPGYKLDFPETTGNCATCHTPAAAIEKPFATDPTNLDGVATEGIPCDFCHKIWEVNLNPHNGLPYQNMPGVLSYQFRRPPDEQQFFSGPLDDVAPGEDTYSPLQTQSQICAPCHFGVFWDVVVYDSFGEWLRSPYSDPDQGKTCQDCHMPRLGVSYFALPEQGGLARDPTTIFSHRMPGGSDELLLQNAVSMTVATAFEGDTLQVEVTVTNDQTGHHVPSGSPLRHLILLVQAADSKGRPLDLQTGPRLPDWCGVGDPDQGFYAGQAGMFYAKVLGEQWTNKSPTGSYWNPTYLIQDNRLAALSSNVTHYAFETRQQQSLQLHIRLLYRRAFIDLMEQKGWQVPDILMEEVFLTIAP